MKSFQSTDYYTYVKSTSREMKDPEKNLTIKLLPLARPLIANYYGDKYGSNIEVVEDKRYWENVAKWIAEDKANPGKDSEYRKAYCVGVPAAAHSTPIIYIQEKIGDEIVRGILLSDSILCIPWRAAIIQNLSEIPVYITGGTRQMDGVSCHLDALIYGRIATAKTSEGEYSSLNLLQKLRGNAKPIESSKGICYETKLPDEYLITAEGSGYFEEQKPEAKSIIHVRKDGGKENILAFRDRYQSPYADSSGFKQTYLIEKAIKLADIVEIQFYIKQLQENLGPLWTSTARNEFVQLSKEFLKSQGQLTPGQTRPGLFEFAKSYLAEFHAKSELKAGSSKDIFQSLVSGGEAKLGPAEETKKVLTGVLTGTPTTTGIPTTGPGVLAGAPVEGPTTTGAPTGAGSRVLAGAPVEGPTTTGAPTTDGGHGVLAGAPVEGPTTTGAPTTGGGHAVLAEARLEASTEAGAPPQGEAPTVDSDPEAGEVRKIKLR